MPGTGYRPRLEALEDRTLPTVVFNSALGGELIEWTKGNSTGHPDYQVVSSPLTSNPTVLQNPTVYFIFWGTSWTTTNAGNLAADAEAILATSYLSLMTDYGSDGRATYGAYTIDNTAAPLPNPSVTTAEIQQVLGGKKTTVYPTSSWTKPKDQNAVDSPIYVVVYDTGTPGTFNGQNLLEPYSATQVMNQISIGDPQNNADGFTNTFTHEIVERIFSGTDTGLEMDAPINAGTDGEYQHAQIADNEPDDFYYTYRLDGALLVQAYWSISFNAFVVPDGNSIAVYLNPEWDTSKSPPKFQQSYGQLYFDAGLSNTTLDAFSNASGGTVFALDGEYFYFDAGKVASIYLAHVAQLSIVSADSQRHDATITSNELTGFTGAPIEWDTTYLTGLDITGSQTDLNIFRVLGTPNNVYAPITTLNAQGYDTVLIGNAGSLAGIQGDLVITDAPSFVTLSVDDSANPSPDGATISGSSITGLAPASIFYQAGGLETLNINGSFQGGVYNFVGTPAGVPTTLTASLNTTVNVGNSGSLADLLGDLTIDDYYAAEVTLIVDDHADTGSHTVNITQAGVTGLAPNSTTISYGQDVLRALTISGSQGGSTYNVLSTPSYLTTTTLNDQGPDRVIVGNNGSLAGISGPVVIQDPPDFTDLTIDDSADASRNHVTITSTRVVGLAPLSAPIEYNPNDLRSLTIKGSQGGSTYDVLSTPANGYLTVTTTLVNQALDKVNVGDHGSLAGIGGKLSITDPASLTALKIDDSSDASAHTVTITNSSITGLAPGTIAYHQANLSGLTIMGGPGSDTYDVLSTPDGTGYSATNLVTAGSAIINVGNAGGVQGIQGTLNLENPSALNTITINDSPDRGARNVTLSTLGSNPADSERNGDPWGQITGLAPGVINYEYADTTSITVDGGSGTNSYAVQATGSFTSLVLNTGAGHDVVTVGNSNSLDDLFGPLMVNGQGGTTRLQIFDQATSGGETYTLAANTLSRSGAATISFSGLQSVSVEGSQGGNLFLVTGLPTLPVTFDGGAGNNTLTGPNVTNIWRIDGPNAGSLDRAVIFNNVQNLVGGAGVDVFKLISPTFNGKPVRIGSEVTINGGGAPAGQGDWLDYSGWKFSSMSVDLATGSATSVGGMVSNIQNVIAGNEGSTLIGNSAGNILIGGSGTNTIMGGSGRSLLIAGAGSSTVMGGSGGVEAGGDILIGGTTRYDSSRVAHLRALMAILAEWQSTDSYATRFHKINTGIGMPDHVRLNYGTTVQDNGQVNTLTAQPGTAALDWFFGNLASGHTTIQNMEAGEHVNNT